MRVTDPENGITAFGLSVALSGRHLLIGAYDDDELANNAGAAYVYRLSASGNLNSASQQIR